MPRGGSTTETLFECGAQNCIKEIGLEALALRGAVPLESLELEGMSVHLHGIYPANLGELRGCTRHMLPPPFDYVLKTALLLVTANRDVAVALSVRRLLETLREQTTETQPVDALPGDHHMSAGTPTMEDMDAQDDAASATTDEVLEDAYGPDDEGSDEDAAAEEIDVPLDSRVSADTAGICESSKNGFFGEQDEDVC